MRTLELDQATETLSQYARGVKKEKEPLLITLHGRPYVTMQAVLPGTDLENLTVSTHPTFQRIIAESRASYRTEGGLTSDEVRKRLGLPPRRVGPKKRAARPHASAKR